MGVPGWCGTGWVPGWVWGPGVYQGEVIPGTTQPPTDRARTAPDSEAGPGTLPAGEGGVGGQGLGRVSCGVRRRGRYIPTLRARSTHPWVSLGYTSEMPPLGQYGEISAHFSET